jgi:hypothetical protein
MKNVIIPSAKKVPEQFEVFSDLPMCLIPVNGEPLLNYLVKEKYKDDQIYVISFENHGSIDDFLASSSFNNVTNCVLEKLGSLGASILAGLDRCEKKELPTVINFGDTMVSSDVPDSDCIFYALNGTPNKKWTYVIENDGVIERIIDKTNNMISSGVPKLVIGVISLSDPVLFAQILRGNLKNKSSFFQSLKDYSKHHPFLFKQAQQWLDFGHPDEYFKSAIEVKSRSFNHISIDKDRGIIKKSSDDENKLKKEIEWYLKLPTDLRYVSPRIYDYSFEPQKTFVSMEYYSYHTALELFLYGDSSEEQWGNIFKSIHFVLKDFSKYQISNGSIKDSLRDVYVGKTTERLDQLRELPTFAPLFKNPIVINGQKYKSLDFVYKEIRPLVEEKLLNIRSFSIIHGDLCFANILVDNHRYFVKLIDPRGSFGSFDIYGDPRYDLAKLYHSIDGKYDFIIKDKFDLSKTGNHFNYRVNCNKDLLPQFNQVFSDFIASKEEIELIESLLFFSMIPLHQENLLHQYAMLVTGYLILDRLVDIRED